MYRWRSEIIVNWSECNRAGEIGLARHFGISLHHSINQSILAGLVVSFLLIKPKIGLKYQFEILAIW
ncbi:hypothetical Protein YC6258_04994 [Gynuella sunshinyii YC6258]|uniref:Uncharacterized protein n=1 Tax=Gynuella sunshinyii YC6258 TaxID=1445510 RepID=A0A0C5VS24_9GAMM|nr:hypothetical Protein YC6258_04994 [Gynuella sunshinyii YC6258]